MDLQQPGFLTYVLIGSVALGIVAIVLYYIPGGKIRLPAIAGTALTCLIAGAAFGVLALYLFGYHWEPGRTSGGQAAGGGRGPGGGGERGGGGPGRRGGSGGGEGPARGMGGPRGGGATTARQPTSKSRLTDLVAKLDLLTHPPVTVKLTDDEKSNIQKQLKGLEDKEEIGEEDAKKTLEALLGILKENKEVLQAAGSYWLAQAETGARPAADIPNPFKEKADGDHLKSLRQQLGQSERLDAKIPPADPDKYKSILDAKDWANPYLVIRSNGIEVVAKAITKEGKVVAPEDLQKTLVSLPLEAWPYGKVVAVQEIGIRSGDDDQAIEKNKEYAKKILEELGIKIEWWPSA